LLDPGLPEPGFPDEPDVPDDPELPDEPALPDRLPVLLPLEPDIPDCDGRDEPGVLPGGRFLLSSSSRNSGDSGDFEPLEPVRGVLLDPLPVEALRLLSPDLLDPLIPDPLELPGREPLPDCDPEPLWPSLFRSFAIRPPALSGALISNSTCAEQCLRWRTNSATFEPVFAFVNARL
jgi:hypothetical protein